MDQATAELRAEIEERRERLGRDLDALGQKVSPSATMARKREAAGSRARAVRERVMGSVEDTRSTVSGRAGEVGHGMADVGHDVIGTVEEAPAMVRRRTEGSPLAMGLVAFGAGVVLAALLPPSRSEHQMVEKARPALDSMKEGAREVASSAAERMQEPAMAAAQAVGDRAQDAVEHVKGDASSAAQDMKETAREGGQSMKGAVSQGGDSSGPGASAGGATPRTGGIPGGGTPGL